MAVALSVPEVGDLVLVGGGWQPCDGRRVPAEARGPLKVYIGFDPRLV